MFNYKLRNKEKKGKKGILVLLAGLGLLLNLVLSLVWALLLSCASFESLGSASLESCDRQ